MRWDEFGKQNIMTRNNYIRQQGIHKYNTNSSQTRVTVILLVFNVLKESETNNVWVWNQFGNNDGPIAIFACQLSVTKTSNRPDTYRQNMLKHVLVHCCSMYLYTMWANAQRDGRPAEYRWRPLSNAADFGWRLLLECRAVTLPRRQDTKPVEISWGAPN